jgi:hypothetical protein
VKNIVLTAACLSLFALAACDKPADPRPEEKNVTTTTNANAPGITPGVATPMPTTPPAITVTITDGDLSTPADFEETAEKAITTKNYKAELTSLESDVSKE